MNTNKCDGRTAVLGGIAVVVLQCGAAQAQEAEAEQEVPSRTVATELDTVTVTALHREKPLQEVPVAISVLEADAIRAKGAQDFRDYLTTVPGVNFTQGNLGGMRVTIRGISDGVGATNPLAGIYIDETPVSETFGATFDPDIYDVDRVEVLKGPQGTLYGSGSMGGTVRVIGRQPQLDWVEGSVSATVSDVSHGGTGGRVDGVVNVPLVDNLMALRVSAGYREDAGWIDDVVRGEKDGNTIEKRNLRAQLLLQPAEETSITTGFMYQKEDLGFPWHDDFAYGDYQTGRVFRPWGAADSRLLSLTVRQDWDRMALVSATNYLTNDSISTLDSTASLSGPISAMTGVTMGDDEGVGVRSDSHLAQFTQEVRLSSSGANRVDWLLGGFYSNAETDFNQVFDFSQAPSVEAVASGASFYTSNQKYETRQLAAFGELTLNATERLSLTAGLRAFDVNQRNLTHSDGIFNGGESLVNQEADNSSSTAKFMVAYQADRDHLLFAQAVQGYRNGGPTGNVPLAACGDALAEAGYDSVPNAYGPDRLWNYEVGSKNTLMDGRLRLNGSVFYLDWSEIQSTISLACGFSFVTNAGRARSKGAELDVSLMPLAGLALGASASYVDARITEVAPGVVAAEDDPLPLSSKWSWNAHVQYERDLSRGLNGFVRAEVNHVGDRWSGFRAAANSRLMDDYTLVSARVGVRRDNWSVALFATNLTDERYAINHGTNYEVMGRPRTVGVTVSTEF
ncbi:TonB-dependent receptor [Luteimonas sp. R10]|uniref:TonB-dependent receptor n=1 Tax=Luteimonas sp. R10 TaxID=3108176 RepID=UPI0030910B16|nr:TonB-dependent receptor [Luteimonas sp. R10]